MGVLTLSGHLAVHSDVSQSVTTSARSVAVAGAEGGPSHGSTVSRPQVGHCVAYPPPSAAPATATQRAWNGAEVHARHLSTSPPLLPPPPPRSAGRTDSEQIRHSYAPSYGSTLTASVTAGIAALWPLSAHRRAPLPPPCRLQRPAAPRAAVSQPSSAHRRPPPCRVQKPVAPRALASQPSSAHRRPPPCRLQKSVAPCALLVQPFTAHRRPPPCRQQ